MDSRQFREYVVQPVLAHLSLHEDDSNAEELLMLTCAQESKLGFYLHQRGHGPAFGSLEMERFTYNDMWDRVIPAHNGLADKLLDLVGSWHIQGARPDPEEMNGNLYFSLAMGRVKYFSIRDAIPSKLSIEALAIYYKRYYNTPGGAATVQQAIDNYKKYVH